MSRFSFFIIMNEILLRHLRTAFLRSQRDLTDFVQEINATFDAQNERIQFLEDNQGSSAGGIKQAEYFYLDDDGDLCQSIGDVDTKVYSIVNFVITDEDGDLCQID